jgi:DNA-binding NarL/FixJ family response regulator
VEDEPLIAEDIAGYLKEYGFEVAGIAESSMTAMNFLNEKVPHAVLLDINLGDGPDGISLAAAIRSQFHIPFVFLTSFADKATLDRAKATMPAGYLLKPFNGNDLMTSLEIAIFNHMNATGALDHEPDIDAINTQLPVELSAREFELLLFLRQGLPNRDIADALFISVNTVKTHLQNLFVKLDSKNRTEAIFRISELMKGKGMV